MIKIFLISLIVVSLFLNKQSFAQQKLYFQSITKDNGLASNRINCIYEDSNGFIWFGTQDGLNRFAGYGVATYRNIPEDTTSIGDNRIYTIIEEPNTGNLWIGTERGLNYFDRRKDRFTRYLQEKKDSVYSFCYDHKGILWIGTSNGLYKYDTDKTFDVFRHSKNNPNSISSDEVHSVIEDKNNNLWLGTDQGLDLYNRKNNAFKHHSKTPLLKYILYIHCAENNDLWIGTYRNGLFHMKSEEHNTEMGNYNRDNGYLLNNRVQSIIEDEKHNLYIADRDGGLIYMDLRNNATNNYVTNIYDEGSINSKALRSMAKTSSGIIWIGTYNSGVNFIDNNRKPFEHFKINYRDDGLFNNNIRAMFQDMEGNIWIGTKEGGGLSKFDRENGTFTHYKHIPGDTTSLNNDYVFSINEIDGRRLIVGTYKKGIDILDKQTGTFSHYPHNNNNPKSISDNRAYAIHKDEKGRFWIGTFGISGASGFLNQFYPDKGEFRHIKDIRQVRCFCNENENSSWIGTVDKGLYLYDPDKGILKHLQKGENGSGLSGNNITSLRKDLSGNLWLGTDGGGINRIDQQGNITKITVKDGLPNNRIFGVLVDDNNNVWVSTAGGLSQINTSTNDIRSFDISDGLQGNEFESYVSLKTKNGEMLFGGRNGFNIFHPDSIKDNKTVPPIIITGFKLNYKEVSIGVGDSPLKEHISQTQSLVLDYTQSVFTFDFVGINFTSPEKNQYAYMLEGFDNNWIEIGNKREATYTNIPAGEYIFKVKGANNDGVWNEKGASINITILPPFWATTWFRLLAFLLLIAIITIIIRLRTRQLDKSKKRLEKKVMDATMEIKSRNEKLRNAKSKLSNIMNQVKLQLGRTSEELLDANNSQASSIEEISSSVEQMALTIKENANDASKMLDSAKIVEKDTELSVEIVSETLNSIQNISDEVAYISEFARLTNLLSLNASIEAARAGVHGKSFAVVANQVKKLAENSQDVAINIDKISEGGLKLSKDANDKIVELKKHINNIVTLIEQINESIQSQSYEAENINNAIQQISTYVNSTSILAEKLDNAINSLTVDD